VVPVVLEPPKAADLQVATASTTSEVEAGPKAIPKVDSHSQAALRGTTQASPPSPAAPQTATGPAVTGAKPPPSLAPHAKSKPDCDPNYFFDDQGRKHFKPECFK
jgi:hypothetical protein